MFLSLLDGEQQKLFWMSARALTEQAGQVAVLDQALLDSLAAECRLDEDPGRMPWAQLVGQATERLANDRYARNAFMLELAGVAAIDRDANAPELIAYGEMGSELGYSEAELVRFLNFASAAAQLLADGRTLISTGDGDS